MRRLAAGVLLLVLLCAGCADADRARSPAGGAAPVGGAAGSGGVGRGDETDTDGPAPLRCSGGTVDLGVHRGFEHGDAAPTRLCAVRGLRSSGPESTPGNRYYVHGAAGRAIVNAAISGAVADLVTAARRDGVPLEATSSFRTMAHQRSLCAADLACRRDDFTYVAPPGFSNHQLGKAIDFAGTSVTGRRSCHRGRAVDPASAVWRFLARHAHRFGLRQYAAESWHWDATRTRDRC